MGRFSNFLHTLKQSKQPQPLPSTINQGKEHFAHCIHKVFNTDLIGTHINAISKITAAMMHYLAKVANS
jgi:hypothetical protein